jgi:hypothetical protein
MAISDYKTTDPSPQDVQASILSPITTALEKAGITPELLTKKLRDELNYTEPKDNIEVATPAAMRIRQEARKDAHKLMSHYPAEKKELSGPEGKPLFPQMTEEEAAQLGDVLSEKGPSIFQKENIGVQKGQNRPKTAKLDN